MHEERRTHNADPIARLRALSPGCVESIFLERQLTATGRIVGKARGNAKHRKEAAAAEAAAVSGAFG